MPPCAVSVALYVVPTVAPGKDVVETESDVVADPDGVAMIANGSDPDVAPVIELTTATFALPGATRSVPEIDAQSVVELTRVVARFDWFHRTTELVSKADPETVSVSAPVPALTEDGEIETMELTEGLAEFPEIEEWG